MDTIWERDPLKPNLPLSPDPKLMLKLKPNLGITAMFTPVIMATTMEDTTLILTDTTILEKGPLKLNLKQLLPPRLRLNPGTDTIADTMVVTGGRFLFLPKSPAIFSIPY